MIKSGRAIAVVSDDELKRIKSHAIQMGITVSALIRLKLFEIIDFDKGDSS